MIFLPRNIGCVVAVDWLARHRPADPDCCWVHIAVTYYGTTLRVFGNGGQVVSYVGGILLSNGLILSGNRVNGGGEKL